MSRMRLLVAGGGVAVGALGVGPGGGGGPRPVYKGASEDRSSLENAKVVDDSETSYAYYAEMEPGRADVYQVYARQGQVFNPSLRVPQSGDLKTFAPAMALIGPGIGKPAS